MSSQEGASDMLCGHPLDSGGHCRNRVNDLTRYCAAGHDHYPSPYQAEASGCRAYRTSNGWACYAHDLESEEWQVAMALGAKPPCRVPLPNVERLHLSMEGDCSRSTLLMLSVDSDASVRRNVAMHRAITDDVVRIILADPNSQVRSALLVNPKVSVSTLEVLSRDGLAAVREKVAHHDSATESIMRKLAKDHDHLVRAAVALSLKAPPDVITNLKQDDNPAVQWSIAVRSGD